MCHHTRMDLKSYIDAHGITQSEIAKAIGTTDATVSRLVNGTRKPGLHLAMDIQKATKGKVRLSDWPRPGDGK